MSDLPRPTPSAAMPADATAVPDADAATSLALADRRRRAWILTWIAGLFATPPSRDLVASYRRGEAALILGELAGDTDLAPGILRMSTALDVDLDDEAATARLGIAHARLFLGVGGPETIAPYESAIRCGGRLFQAPTGEMAALLAAHDLCVAETLREPPDHLSIELALMARLIATDHSDRPAFLERLTAWVPEFCDLVVDRDASGFWAGAAEVLTVVLDHESRDVDFTLPQSPIN